MATLTPVDHDPFAPSQPKLTPVDIDPFADPESEAAATMRQTLLGSGVTGPWNAPKDQSLGQTAFWNKPADKTWGEYAGAHFQPVDDMVRHATNVFGLGDRFAAYMDEKTAPQQTVGNLVKEQITGKPDYLAQERAKSAEADARMPEQNRLAGDVLGTLPIGGLNVAGKAVKYVAPYVKPVLGRAAPYVTGVAANSAENAAVGTAAAYGRGEDPVEGGKWGAITGALSAIPGGFNRGGTLPKTPSAADFDKKASGLYDFSGTIKYGPNQIDKLTNRMSADINKLKPRDIEDGTNATAIVAQMKAEAAKYGGMSAERLNDFNKKLWGIDTNPNAAKATQAQIDTFLTKAPPQTPHRPATVKKVLADANKAYGQSEDLKRLQGWQDSATRTGDDVGKQAGQYLNTGRSEWQMPTDSPVFQATDTLAKTKVGPSVSLSPTTGDFTHAVAPMVSGAIAGGVAGGESSHWDPMATAGGALSGLVLGTALHKVPQWYQQKLAIEAQKRAIDATRATIGTGRLYEPLDAPAKVREGIRDLNRMWTATNPGQPPNPFEPRSQ